jgi:hypothetical protein
MDESSTQNEKEPAACVAGYVASGKQWATFGEEWNRALDLGEVSIFHTKEFVTAWGRHGTVYENWSGEKRDRFLGALLDIVKTNTLKDVGVGIYYSDYEKVMTKARRKRFGNIHALCALFCMLHAGAWAHASKFPNAPCFIFEAGGGYTGQMMRAHSYLSKHPDWEGFFRFSTLAFKPKSRLTPGLQAADLLAYELGKRVSHIIDFSPPEDALTEILDGKTIRRTRIPLAILYSDSEPNIRYITADHLDAQLTIMEQD